MLLSSVRTPFKLIAAALDTVTEQSQIIYKNEQNICKLSNDNMHLKSRVHELENIVSSYVKYNIAPNVSQNPSIDSNTISHSTRIPPIDVDDHFEQPSINNLRHSEEGEDANKTKEQELFNLTDQTCLQPCSDVENIIVNNAYKTKEEELFNLTDQMCLQPCSDVENIIVNNAYAKEINYQNELKNVVVIQNKRSYQSKQINKTTSTVYTTTPNSSLIDTDEISNNYDFNLPQEPSFQSQLREYQGKQKNKFTQTNKPISTTSCYAFNSTDNAVFVKQLNQYKIDQKNNFFRLSNQTYSATPFWGGIITISPDRLQLGRAPLPQPKTSNIEWRNHLRLVRLMLSK